MVPSRLSRLIPLALVALLALAAAPAFAQDPAGDLIAQPGNTTVEEEENPPPPPGSPELTLSLQAASGAMTESFNVSEAASLMAAFTHGGSPMQVQLWAIASKDGKEVWDDKTPYMQANPGDSVLFKLPLTGFEPGDYLMQVYVIDDGGNILEVQGASRFSVEGTLAAPIAIEEGSPWFMIVLVGTVVTTAAGVGLGMYDRSLQTKGKPLLPDVVILATGLAGGLLGLLVAFKVTKHPERSNVEMITWILLGVQVLLFLALAWLTF